MVEIIITMFHLLDGRGGVKGGQAIGATDELGFQAVENRAHVHDLHATILRLMGSTAPTDAVKTTND